MTAKRFRHILNMTERTVRSAAQEMDIHERTLHRWLSGELPIPKIVELLLECWANHIE